MLTGTIVYHFLEKWSWLDSAYYSVITLTTIGFGDFTPVTPAGKVFTMFYVFASLGVIFAFVNLISKRFIKRRIKARKRK